MSNVVIPSLFSLSLSASQTIKIIFFLYFSLSMISGSLNSGEIELNTTGFIYSEPTTADAAAEIRINAIEDGTDLTILYGIVVVLTGAFCFGTMHVPIRRYAQENDGIFVQWVMSFGSLMVGFVVNMLMGSPPVQLLATGGGIFWNFANTIAQFVISGLGLAPALLLWSTTNILTGWSAGRFGLFGLKKKTPEHDMLNVFGLITIISGGICFAFIKKSLLPVSNKQAHVYPRMRSLRSTTELFDAEEGAGNGRNGSEGDDGGKMDDNSSTDDVFENESNLSTPKHENNQKQQNSNSSSIVGRKTSLEHPSFLLSVPQIMVTEDTVQEKERRKQQQQNPFFQFTFAESSGNSSASEPIEKQSRCKRFRKWMMRNSHRLLCIFLSLVSGFFYAATVLPVLYIQDNLEKFPGAPKSGLNYIFSHYFGIFLGATAIFITYALLKKNKPTVNPQVILPSLASGAIWGCGMVSLFLSNDLLTQTITYPVLITIPGCVAAIWSIFYFKEIQMSRRNTTIISIAFTLIFTGAFMVFVSKSKFHFDKILMI